MTKIILNRLLIPLLAALVVVAALGWSFWKMTAMINDLRQTSNGIIAKVAFSEKERRAGYQTALLSKEREGDIRRINSFFVDRKQPIDFVENLESLAGKTKNNFMIDLDENQGKIEKDLFFRVSVEGSKETVQQFLKLMELMPYKIEVQELVFQSISPGENYISPLGKSLLINPKPTFRTVLLIKTKTL